jgi:hypothetical protein
MAAAIKVSRIQKVDAAVQRRLNGSDTLVFVA